MFAQFRRETNDFQRDIFAMSNDELVFSKIVTDPFLSLAPQMLQHLKAKYHARFREAFAYLATLQGQQQIAIAKFVHTKEIEIKGLKKLIADWDVLTDEQRKERIKKYLAWEQQSK